MAKLRDANLDGDFGDLRQDVIDRIAQQIMAGCSDHLRTEGGPRPVLEILVALAKVVGPTLSTFKGEGRDKVAVWFSELFVASANAYTKAMEDPAYRERVRQVGEAFYATDGGHA